VASIDVVLNCPASNIAVDSVYRFRLLIVAVRAETDPVESVFVFTLLIAEDDTNNCPAEI
jgi:hypothetical protein